jgi:hypothetical protein
MAVINNNEELKIRICCCKAIVRMYIHVFAWKSTKLYKIQSLCILRVGKSARVRVTTTLFRIFLRYYPVVIIIYCGQASLHMTLHILKFSTDLVHLILAVEGS